MLGDGEEQWGGERKEEPFPETENLRGPNQMVVKTGRLRGDEQRQSYHD
jgi:hypothetical protein